VLDINRINDACADINVGIGTTEPDADSGVIVAQVRIHLAVPGRILYARSMENQKDARQYRASAEQQRQRIDQFRSSGMN
jgi:hypothetical protein